MRRNGGVAVASATVHPRRNIGYLASSSDGVDTNDYEEGSGRRGSSCVWWPNALEEFAQTVASQRTTAAHLPAYGAGSSYVTVLLRQLLRRTYDLSSDSGQGADTLVVVKNFRVST